MNTNQQSHSYLLFKFKERFEFGYSKTYNLSVLQLEVLVARDDLLSSTQVTELANA